jgi:hypothetical protein
MPQLTRVPFPSGLNELTGFTDVRHHELSRIPIFSGSALVMRCCPHRPTCSDQLSLALTPAAGPV